MGVGVVSIVQQMGEQLVNRVETRVMEVEANGLKIMDEIDFQFQWEAHVV